MKNKVQFSWKSILIVFGVAVVPVTLMQIKDTWIAPTDCTTAERWEIYLMSVGFSFSVTTLLFFGLTQFFNYLQQHMPWERGQSKRLFLEISGILVYTTIVMAALSFAYFNLRDMEHVTREQFIFENVIIANAISLLVMLVVEGIFLFRQWRISALRAERLEREKLQSQYSSLKAQLNPHFLFNSLNSLLTLVREDPERSEKFIIQLSKVYRYVIENKNRYAVPLDRELDFAESYFFLHRIRFGNNIQLEVELPKRARKQYIPPLTLQLLLENAIKHNVIAASRPLVITISMNQEGRLLVTNNYQPRTDEVESTGVGHENLRKNYELLNGSQPYFGVREQHYVAEIPLLEMELVES